MKLFIPEQSEPTDKNVPHQPRKLKKQLAKLPNANMGELTRQVYQILRDLNRQIMPVKNRLENMEMLREPAREIFNYLKKYFINRTLPLPEKSKKIVNLNQSLLQEMAYGYKIILADTTKQNSKIDPKIKATASCRAMHYLTELLLRYSEIYALTPKGIWHDLHMIYMFATNNKLLEMAIEDSEIHTEQINAEQCYKQAVLFALARPDTLSQSDSERVYNKLGRWVDYCQILQQAEKSQADRIFCIKLNKDQAPDYLTEPDLEEKSQKIFLDTTPLVAHIRKLIDLSASQPTKLAVGDEISTATLTTLANNWGTNTKRRFSRADTRGRITVSIGLSAIVTTINNSTKKAKGVDTRSGLVRSERAKTREPDLTLETIQGEASKLSSGYVTHTEIGGSDNNPWDMVARGTPLTDAYANEQQKRLKEEESKFRKPVESNWEIINISAGGYCLRWNSDETSRAQIGEIIALHEKVSNNSFEWRIGVIRWMQFTQENGLEIGIQVISPKVITAAVHRVNRPNETPFECLMLPGVKALKQASAIILPAHAFKTSDKLVVSIFDKKLPITLGLVKEHTGSFTQFHYTNTDEAARIKKQANKAHASSTQDDFDEIWSSL